jgi:hypothetical protein
MKLCILVKNGSRISWECIKKKILNFYIINFFGINAYKTFKCDKY